MGELTRREMEKLILGYEDLEGAEKALADRCLAAHPELAARLKWHQEKEAAAADLPLGQAAWPEGELTPADRQAQQESLRRLLARLEASQGPGRNGAAGADQPPSLGARLRHQARWLLPLAAILALAVIMPRGGTEKVLLQNLTVEQVQLLPDGSRGAGHVSSDGEVLHTGDAFELDFQLNEDSYVVVYHVGPAGQVSRVLPETITDTLSPHSGGQGHQIPDPATGEVWILGSETGRETFLVGTARNWPEGLADLSALTDLSGGPTSEPRAQTIAHLKRRLERLMDEVHLYEFEHVD